MVIFWIIFFNKMKNKNSPVSLGVPPLLIGMENACRSGDFLGAVFLRGLMLRRQETAQRLSF